MHLGYHFVFNILRLRQNGWHFPDDIFKLIFLNENVWILIKILLKFVPKGPINNIPALLQIMAWRWPGDKPLSEPIMVSLLMHICITQSQRVNSQAPGRLGSNFKNTFSGNMLQIKLMNTLCEIALSWIPKNTFDHKLLLVQVMAWCC